MSYQLTPEHAKLWLPVVRELREYYEGKNDKFVHRCPLCQIAESFTCCDFKCKYCLWTVFEGGWCENFVKDVRMKRKNRLQSWCKQSISRLKRWERRLEEIIREREK